jgi:Mrp family chromosome partitioning ATPase
MPQPEVVKSRIVDVEWSPVTAEPPPAAAPPTPVVQTQALTTVAWSSPSIVLMEEVELTPALDPRLVVLRDPSSPQARGYRLLEHRLLAQGNPRVIAVTSAERGEGKTTCAANLALVLSEETASRVLLVDANLPRPGVSDLFGFEPTDSFMIKLLRSEDPAPPHAVASVGGLRLQLAALHPTVARGKRLDRMLFATALHELRRMYDYIVIDTASVLESADANSVSLCADGVLVAARAGRSRKSALARAMDQLKPAPIMGTVLIDA